MFSFIASVVCDKLILALSGPEIINKMYHPFLWCSFIALFQEAGPLPSPERVLLSNTGKRTV